MPDVRPILIAAGGTGGHVYPALAIAEVLRERGIPIVWLGTRNGTEATAVPAAGFPIEWINMVGLRGKSFGQTLLAPVRLVRAVIQTWRVFSRHRPAGVLGMGGFVAAPGALLAVVRRLPLILHEQNSIAGLTNRVFSRFAKKVFTAFPGVLSERAQSEYVGNPVRQDIEQLPESGNRVLQHQGRPRLLIVGGSLGARALNQAVPDALALLGFECDVLHQCGYTDSADTKARYQQLGLEADVEPFISDIAKAYDWSDLVVCRSGAMTVTELAAAGVPSVLVPYPFAVDDHQTGNAEWLSAVDAAILLPQSELDPARLATILKDTLNDRSRLQRMALAARTNYKPGAAVLVADALQGVAA